MFIAIPFISFLLFWAGFYQQNRQGPHSFLYAASLWGGIVWIFTEVSKLFSHMLSFGPLLLGWSVVFLGAGLWLSSYKFLPFKPWGFFDFISVFSIDLTLTEKLILFVISHSCFKMYQRRLQCP